MDPALLERIWTVVASVPEGRVATYGQIAGLAGLPRGARLVGRALGSLERNSRVPWHRIINARGQISIPGDSPAFVLQRQRLMDEGVDVSPSGKVSLKRFQWHP
ncbi:MGMT family protein [Hahella sp. SMD15-11]|uniref:MGMT family protein n=1 Tax=Thermohahella caldifontis TaxID=3142973 RepID=A0AB39UZ06_9GAMM